MNNSLNTQVSTLEIDLDFSSLEDRASTLTKGQGNQWPEAWVKQYKVH